MSRGALRLLAENLWDLDLPLKMPGLRFSHRMTVARLRNGDLWVHSPVEFNQTLAEALAQFGPVRHLIAPSRYHDLHWREWLARYPGAMSYCPPGFREEHPELNFQRVFSPGAEAWEDELAKVFIAGMPRINEYVFLHGASRSLIVADLIFNLDPGDQTAFGRLFLKLNGIYGRAGCSRMFRWFIKERAAFRRSMEQVLALDFDRIIIGHGANVMNDGKNILRAAMAGI